MRNLILTLGVLLAVASSHADTLCGVTTANENDPSTHDRILFYEELTEKGIQKFILANKKVIDIKDISDEELKGGGVLMQVRKDGQNTTAGLFKFVWDGNQIKYVNQMFTIADMNNLMLLRSEALGMSLVCTKK